MGCVLLSYEDWFVCELSWSGVDELSECWDLFVLCYVAHLMMACIY